MLETLYSHPTLRYIWRLVDFAYSVPTGHYMGTGITNQLLDYTYLLSTGITTSITRNTKQK